MPPGSKTRAGPGPPKSLSCHRGMIPGGEPQDTGNMFHCRVKDWPEHGGLS